MADLVARKWPTRPDSVRRQIGAERCGEPVVESVVDLDDERTTGSGGSDQDRRLGLVAAREGASFDVLPPCRGALVGAYYCPAPEFGGTTTRRWSG